MSVLAHTGVRIGEALSRDVEHLGHDRGTGSCASSARVASAAAQCSPRLLSGRSTRTSMAARPARSSSPRRDGGWTSPRRGAWSAVSPAGQLLDGAGEISPHSLRVAFITGAREAGVPLEDVQDAAGHADPRTTRRYDRGRHSLDRHASYAVTAWLTGQDNE